MNEQKTIDIALQKLTDAGQIAARLLIDIAQTEISIFTAINPNFTEEMKLKGQKQMIEISKKLWEFQQTWQEAPIHSNRIDLKLFKTSKVDFELMQQMMDMSCSGTSANTGLYLIKRFVTEYKKACELGKIEPSARIAKNLEELTDFEINIVQEDIKKVKLELDNVNLYYQNVMVSKAVKVAYASLLVSAFAVALTIIQAIHII